MRGPASTSNERIPSDCRIPSEARSDGNIATRTPAAINALILFDGAPEVAAMTDAQLVEELWLLALKL